MFKNELWVAMECLMGGTLHEAKSHFQFHEKHIKYMYVTRLTLTWFTVRPMF